MKQAIQILMETKNVDAYLSMRESWDAAEMNGNSTPFNTSTETEHTVTIPNSFGNWTLIKGQLNQKAAIAFSTGPCADFAYALHQKTGWPYITAVEAGSYTSEEDFNETWDDYDDSGMVHVLLQRPDGKLVDAAGVRSEKEYLQETEPNQGPVTLYKTDAKFVKAHMNPDIKQEHLRTFAEAAIRLSKDNQRVSAEELQYSE